MKTMERVDPKNSLETSLSTVRKYCKIVQNITNYNNNYNDNNNNDNNNNNNK